MNGHGDYEACDLAMRKQPLSAFRVFFHHAPVRYHCITLRIREQAPVDDLAAAMRKQLVDFIFGRLEHFQHFDSMKIYYDNGKSSIADAMHKAVDYALSKNAVVCRLVLPEDYRL